MRYLGLSADGLPFHYLANEPHTDQRIPTQFASFGELRRLLKVVRDRGRVWQTTPILEKRAKGFAYFFLTSGRLFGKPLKTSALSVLEFVLAPAMARRSFLGLDVGSLAIGAQADITMIDPGALAAWDDNANRRLEYRDIFQHQQMVSRSDGVVTRVLINGEVVWEEGDYTAVLGSRPLGRVLRAG